MINILIIGLGYHARRIQFPITVKEGSEFDASIKAVVDIHEQKCVVEEYLKSKNADTIERLYLTTLDTTGNNWHTKLDEIVTKHKINAVYIATEPLWHFEYARWALDKGLHILMDKPITTNEDVSTSKICAEQLLDDFLSLKQGYENALKLNSGLVFSVLAQRRFHPVYKKVGEYIREVFKETNCPITFQSSFHCDGQWRFPEEIVNQDYHPYNQGYGKISHSGYHSIDVLATFLKETDNGNKKIDSMEVFAQATRPVDFLSQFTVGDYRKFFNEDEAELRPQEVYEKLMQGYGEIDVVSTLAFKQNDKTITLASLNLLHNGFSQRDWPHAHDRDLYKGNGRIRQETHVIEQGPFQSIFINSYQSKEIMKETSGSDYDIGGERHLDILVFRNNKLISRWKPFEEYSVNDIMPETLEGYSRGHQEEARRVCILEFLRDIRDGTNIEHQTSNILDHEKTVRIFTSIYKSLSQSSDKEVNTSIQSKY
jgi:predicted dehydrogenase